MNSNSMNQSGSMSKQKNGVSLPRIAVTASGEVHDNPFYIPPEEEIFKLKDQEKEQQRQERMANLQKHIWEKGMKQSKEGMLRRLYESSKEILEEDEEGEGADKNSKINIVDAAKSAIKNRVRHIEPLPNFIAKKREMFLFQMAIDQKKEQIKEFEELAHLQELGLQKSEQMLEEDLEAFNRFLEENKNKCRNAIKLAEDETKKKQDKILEIKQLNEAKSSIMSKNGKLLEKLSELWGFKVFLDGLTPQEHLEEQKRQKQDRKHYRNDSSDVAASTKRKGFSIDSYKMDLPKGLLELIEDSDDDFEMYFKNPEQIQDYFQILEEKNQFLIRNTQELEQNLDEVRHKYGQKSIELTEKKKQLTHNLQESEKSIQQKTKLINNLTTVQSDNQAEQTLKMLEGAIKLIFERSFDRGDKNENARRGEEMLKEIEKKIESQIKDIKAYDKDKAEAEEKKRMKERKDEINSRNRELDDKEKTQKLKNIQKRMQAQKRFGRPIMFKSNPPQKEEKEEVKDEVDQDEVDRQRYFTLRFY